MKAESVSPDSLKRFLGKPVRILLNRGRRVCGTLQGFDERLNVNLYETVQEKKVCGQWIKEEVGVVIIRGSSIIHVEVLDKISLEENIELLNENLSLLTIKEKNQLSENLNLTANSEDNLEMEMFVPDTRSTIND